MTLLGLKKHPTCGFIHEKHRSHSQGAIDRALLSTHQGVSAIKWSALALILKALIQLAVVLVSII
jgi:hypothetical protein